MYGIRKGRNKVYVAIAIWIVALAFPSCGGKSGYLAQTPRPEDRAKNIILFIGDGMGAGQIKAAGIYRTGAEGTLSFEAFPYKGFVSTSNAEGEVTDSAAAATAMATGTKVSNGVLAVALPGDGMPLKTSLEIFKKQGKRTGLVTTTSITHATPAAFASHVKSRDSHEAIAAAYLNESRPDILFGGGGNVTESDGKKAGYTVVTDRDGMMTLEAGGVMCVLGIFGTGNLPFESDGLGNLPHLSEMTQVALHILEHGPHGFFLMVEGGLIDHASHANDMTRTVLETIEFSNAVAKTLDWARTHPDSLILVTADHETGGLQVVGNNGRGSLPAVTWSTTGHTRDDVPVYGWGNGAERISGNMENTDIFQIILRSATNPSTNH